MPAAVRCPIKAANPLSREASKLALCRDAACRHLAVPGWHPGPREASRPGGEACVSGWEGHSSQVGRPHGQLGRPHGQVGRPHGQVGRPVQPGGGAHGLCLLDLGPGSPLCHLHQALRGPCSSSHGTVHTACRGHSVNAWRLNGWPAAQWPM